MHTHMLHDCRVSSHACARPAMRPHIHRELPRRQLEWPMSGGHMLDLLCALMPAESCSGSSLDAL